MYETPNRPAVPLLRVADPESLSRYPGTAIGDDANTDENRRQYLLRWEPVEEHLKLVEEDRKYNKCVPAFKVLPEELKPVIDSFRFNLRPHNVREIAWQTKRGIEEYSRPFPEDYLDHVHETADRDACYYTAVPHFRVAFRLLCWDIEYPTSAEVLTKLGLPPNERGEDGGGRCDFMFIAQILLGIRLWDGQTGCGLVVSESNFGINLEKFRAENKFIDNLFNDIDKRMDEHYSNYGIKIVEVAE
jgi:hypothetical protein